MEDIYQRNERITREHARHKQEDVLDDNQPIFSGYFEFTGQVGAFYRIWLINIAMAVFSLGVLYPWAHRNIKTYLYKHTKLDGESFEYRNKEWKTLIYLAIRVVFIFCMSVFLIEYTAFAVGLLIVCLPAIVNAMIRRNLRMTYYRDVSFDFKGSYIGTLFYIFVFPIAGFLVSGLLFPLALKMLNHYLLRNFRLGKEAFVTKVSYFHYSNFMITIALFFLAFIVIQVGSIFLLTLVQEMLVNIDAEYTFVTNLLFILTLFGLSIFFLSALIITIYTQITKAALNHTEIPCVLRFDMETIPFKYALFASVGVVAMIFTLGLAYPWVKIRKSRRLASETRVTIYPQALNILGVKKSQVRDKNFDV